MIEKLRILTGTPAEVETKLAAAFAEHTNTTILSSCMAVSYPMATAVIGETKPATKQAKAKAKDEAQESTIPNPPSPIAPQEHLCVIIGRKF